MVCGLVATSCLTFATPWTVACQAPLSMGFSRQEHWSGLPFPSLRDLPDPGIEPRSPALQADSLPTKLQGKPIGIYRIGQKVYSGFFVLSEMGTSSPLVKALPSSVECVGLIPGQGGPDLVGQKKPPKT